MFEKFKKAAIVVFITCLIWVWADLSLDKDLADQTVTVITSKGNPNLWVTIDGKPEIQVKADFRGPAKRITELVGRINAGKEKLDVVFDAESQNMAEAGEYTLQDVRRFLAESEKIREYGLAVKAARPDKLQNIKVVELKEKTLPLTCVDDKDNKITGARLIPDIITMLVPDNVIEARVKIVSSIEERQARGGTIDKKPYVALGNGEMRYSDLTVKVTLPTAIQNMKQHTISGTLGFVFSANLAGKYDVEFIKQPEIGSITIFATDEAKAAYEEESFEVLLGIKDEDVGKEEVSRQVIYNFPVQYVREDKIRLKGDPAEAKFRLVPVKQTPLSISE
ncbi:MAG: hypothetical protein JW806_09160 [Sedimentisphaerales bacterium]|nr:hypothetical protein [Sedimentisphaerales bacterium]